MLNYIYYESHDSVQNNNNQNMTSKYNFVSEPDDALKCLIYLEVAEEPWQHGKCGGLFCKECLDRTGLINPCPNCSDEQPLYFEDNRGKYYRRV